jgi:hypothetical protein
MMILASDPPTNWRRSGFVEDEIVIRSFSVTFIGFSLLSEA